MRRAGLMKGAVLVVTMLVVASGAGEASAAQFTAGATGASLSAKTLVDHQFTITSSKADCEETSLSGVTTGIFNGSKYVNTSLTVTPSYSKCKAFGVAVSITNVGNKCKFTLEADESMDIFGAGCELVLEADYFYLGCKVVMGPNQDIPLAVSYTNGSGDLVMHFHATPIEAEVTESWGLCPIDKGWHTVVYSGESTVTAASTTLGFDT
jgi:hypothetical protein